VWPERRSNNNFFMKKEHIKLIVKFVLIVLFIVFVFWVNRIAVGNGMIMNLASRFGYIGILLVSAISGFNLLVPIPIITFFPFFLEAGFHPVITLCVIAFGMTLGDLLGFLIGDTSREVYKPKSKKIIARLEALRDKHHAFPLVFMFLYASFAPIPNELVVVPLAFLGFRMWKVMLAVFFGNIIFNTLFAFSIVQAFQLF